MNQRWRNGRATYRPAGETIRTSDYDVSEIRGDGPAKAFVRSHHYSTSFPAARFRYGLYRKGELAGVAVFSVPCRPEVLTSVYDAPPADSVELGRFVLLDVCPANSETWFLARALRLLAREGMIGVVSHSDPFPRRAADGRIVFAGHYGCIYLASNAAYLGRAGRSTLRLLPDGKVLSARAIQKIRAREKGYRYAAGLLAAYGASPLADGDDAREWIRRWVPALTRAVRHPGNHKYAFPLVPAAKRMVERYLSAFPFRPIRPRGPDPVAS